MKTSVVTLICSQPQDGKLRLWKFVFFSFVFEGFCDSLEIASSASEGFPSQWTV